MFGWRQLLQRVAPEGLHLLIRPEVLLSLQVVLDHDLSGVVLSVAVVVRNAHHVVQLVLEETLLPIEQTLDAFVVVIGSKGLP